MAKATGTDGEVAVRAADVPGTVRDDAVLAPGDSVGWTSDGSGQGNAAQYGAQYENGCGANGLCGLPYSSDGLGGGWQICFA